MTQQAPSPPASGARQVFPLAWPMMLKAMFLHGIVVIDGLLVSALGESAVAALGLAAAFGGIILGMLFAFGHAMQIRSAQAFGTKDPVFLKSALGAGLAISVGIGIAGVVIISALAPVLLTALAPTAEIAAEAQAYLMVFTLVILGESVGQCLSSYFNGCGRTRVPLYGYCLSVPINVLTSVVLIHGLWGFPALGVTGAAIGSALGVAVQTAYFVAHLLSQDRAVIQTPGWRQTRFSGTVARHMRFALPIAATFISANLATHVCAFLYAQMEIYAFAALILIAPWNMLAGQISQQWTQATGILIAQLLGQRAREAALDQFLSSAWRGAFVAAAAVALVFVVMCLSVDLIYPDLSVETRATLFAFLPLLVLLQFPRATNATCGNTLRASGDTVYVMNLFILSQWGFRVPATALAILYFDAGAVWIVGVWLAEEILKFLPFHTRLWQGAWKQADVADDSTKPQPAKA